MTAQKKADVLDVVRLHGSKIDEALEAVRLLQQALHAMDADEALCATLERENTVAQLFVSELAESALYEPLRAAERHIKEANRSINSFIRIFNSAFNIHNGRP